MFSWINNIWIALAMLIGMSWVVSKAADKLGDVLHVLGLKLKIPTSVRGATFDAISSSFPEFSTAMIAVLVYKKFVDVGVPTIAGSGIFNILVIPMASIIAFKGKDLLIQVDRRVVYRDMTFYLLSLSVLALFTYLGSYTPFTGVILIAIYMLYIIVLYRETKSYRENLTYNDLIKEKEGIERILEEEEEDDIDINMGYGAIIIWIIIAIAFIWFSIDAIIQSAMVIAVTFNIPQYIVSVVIIAACTSIPDTLLSVKSARMGDAEGAVSNAVGSNIFDICVCLGLPMMIVGHSIPSNFSQSIGVLIFVFASMLTTALILLKKKGVKRNDAIIMGLVYIGFLVYAVGVGLNLFS